ncbi:MAG: hypothetical protein EA369_03055 [Bradymonadales bacterium]|nr:MAG: hypothetical protein EA369_03055 [Bradymonadales bacterium]
MRYHFLEDQEKAGVRPINSHALRHTYASHDVMKGGALYDLQGLLGHSSTEVTKRYAHLAPDLLMAKANVVTFAATI